MGATPTTVSSALLPQPLHAADLVLQPLSVGTYLFLDKIESPVLEAGAKVIKGMDLFRCVFALAHPLDQCLEVWAMGKEPFDAAVIGYCSQIPLGEIDQLAMKVLEHVQASFAPVAKLKPEGEAGLIPLAPAVSPPASAGS